MPVPPHPEPPPDLHRRHLPITRTHQAWWRLHRCAYGAIYFGKSGTNRFDAPGGEQGEFGVLYAAADAYGAFIETLGRATGANRVDMQLLRETCLSRLTTVQPLKLVDLRGPGLARLGADERLCAGDDYELCGRWALALYHHPVRPDGLYFRARHDPARFSLALFSRDATAQGIQAQSQGALTDPANTALLAEILDRYQFQLLP